MMGGQTDDRQQTIIQVHLCFQLRRGKKKYTGADKYIIEALALGQVAQQNLLALPSNLLALL